MSNNGVTSLIVGFYQLFGDFNDFLNFNGDFRSLSSSRIYIESTKVSGKNDSHSKDELRFFKIISIYRRIHKIEPYGLIVLTDIQRKVILFTVQFTD